MEAKSKKVRLDEGDVGGMVSAEDVWLWEGYSGRWDRLKKLEGRVEMTSASTELGEGFPSVRRKVGGSSS